MPPRRRRRDHQNRDGANNTRGGFVRGRHWGRGEGNSQAQRRDSFGQYNAPNTEMRPNRRHWARGSGNAYRGRQECNHSEASASQNSGAPEIPGFYYDESKKKYFKILPGHCNVQGGVTQESIKIKLTEQKRQDDLAQIGKNIASSFLQHNGNVSIHPKCVLRSPKFTDNIYNMVERTKCSYFANKINTFEPSSRQSVMHMVSRLKPAGKLKIFENPVSSYEKLEHMLNMKVNEEQDKMLCLWGLREQIVQRIQMININGINKFDGDGVIDIDVSPTGAVLLQSFSKVTDMCWAPLEGSDPLDCCILYTTTCFLGNNPSLALMRRLNPDSTQGFKHTEFNLGQKATWACAWNGKTNQLSVGSEECALLLDVPTRRMWELHTGNSDVRSQTFQKENASMLYSGTKKGIIYGHDLRTLSVRPSVVLKQGSCVCQMQFPRDSNYLFAADFNGMIKQWDLRQRKVVIKFQGHNEYSRTPFHIDTTETVISSAGQDCYTRVWDIRTGGLLISVPPPHPASRDTIPPSHLFSLPCNTIRQPGLLMGSRDELHFYSHHG